MRLFLCVIGFWVSVFACARERIDGTIRTTVGERGRADGTLVPLPLYDVTTFTEAFRRAGLPNS